MKKSRSRRCLLQMKEEPFRPNVRLVSMMSDHADFKLLYFSLSFFLFLSFILHVAFADVPDVTVLLSVSSEQS